ncbi:MAG: DUF1223 domain-containing protein [Sediminibacterium sp.]
MKRKMLWIQRLSFAGFSALLVFSALALISSKNRFTASEQVPVVTTDNKAIVVMELFTSQGCSSCPPADALLAEYSKLHNEHIITLSFHVDYWNRLGWADPFSSSAYSTRQQWYSQHLPRGSVYTPQLIVNGRGEAVGNNRNAVNGLVQKELTGTSPESLSVDNIVIGKNAINFHYTTISSNKDEVLNVALVQKEVTTHVKAGENEGVTITNHNIVRSFTTMPITEDGTGQVAIPASFKPDDYALVLYIQNKKDLLIGSGVMKNLL